MKHYINMSQIEKDSWAKILKDILSRKGIETNYEIEEIRFGGDWEPDIIILKNGLELYDELNGYSWCATENNKKIRYLLDNPEKYDMKKVMIENKRKAVENYFNLF